MPRLTQNTVIYAITRGNSAPEDPDSRRQSGGSNDDERLIGGDRPLPHYLSYWLGAAPAVPVSENKIPPR